MPRFSSKEKTTIKERLFNAGERLFVQYGIRKVTIDDLTKAAGIAVGSFYSFFESKESLYLEINIKKQNDLLSSLERELLTYKKLMPKDFAKKVTKRLFEKYSCEPILAMLDIETWNYITRKVSPQLLQQHSEQDINMVLLIIQSGVSLRYSPEQTVKTMQILFTISKDIFYSSAYPGELEIIIDGVVNQLVLD